MSERGYDYYMGRPPAEFYTWLAKETLRFLVAGSDISPYCPTKTPLEHYIYALEGYIGHGRAGNPTTASGVCPGFFSRVVLSSTLKAVLAIPLDQPVSWYMKEKVLKYRILVNTYPKNDLTPVLNEMQEGLDSLIEQYDDASRAREWRMRSPEQIREQVISEEKMRG
jgi:hypothetical protein